MPTATWNWPAGGRLGMEIKVVDLGMPEDWQEDVLYNVYNHTAIWVKRMQKAWPMWTFGRSSYLDTMAEKENQYIEAGHLAPVNHKYLWEAESGQDFMRESFRDLYNAVREGLAGLFDKRVVLTQSLCVPGFHIFYYHPFFQFQSGIWHRDLNWLNIGMENKGYGSFTAPVSLPECGTGLEWTDGENIFDQPYTVGDMYVHDGMTPHRIPAIPGMKPNDRRITLQGHFFINSDDEIELFW